MNKIKSAVVSGYHKMEQNYFTFRILVWLKELGIMRKVSTWVADNGSAPDDQRIKAMQRSKAFFTDNAERAKKMLALLADDKSREVWKAVVRLRAENIPIKPELYSENDQYFVDGIIQIDNNEVFVDGGGYTGDTAQQFMDIAKKQGVKFKRIVVFEPDERNCRLIRRFLGKRKDITIVPKGLSDKEKVLSFAGDGPFFRVAGSNEENVINIPVTTIDAVPECQDATWIKMDIEGAELDALHGAKQVIQRNRPKLTICLYHSNADMIQITEYVHELVPEYKLYVRCHRKSGGETVLYAVL